MYGMRETGIAVRSMAAESGKGFRLLAPFFAKLSRVALSGALLLTGVTAGTAASLYNVAKVAVDVTAKDAVVARDTGMAEAEMRAWDILVDRLVPPHARSRVQSFTHDEIQGLVAGVAIGKEEGSDTRYVAVLDVRFDPYAVRRFLASRSIPFGEDQASSISILPVLLQRDRVARDEGAEWQRVWERLDLANGVAPATLVTPRDDLDARTIRELQAGEESAYAALRSVYGYGGLVVATGETVDGVFRTHLAGEDAAGPIDAVVTSAVDRHDLEKTLDEAARGALATLETRWKQRLDMAVDEASAVIDQRGALFPDHGSEGAGAPLGRVGAVVEFSTVRDWQRIRFSLQRVAGLNDFTVETLDARAASVRFDFDGSADVLQALLAQYGVALYERDGTLVLRTR